VQLLGWEILALYVVYVPAISRCAAFLMHVKQVVAQRNSSCMLADFIQDRPKALGFMNNVYSGRDARYACSMLFAFPPIYLCYVRLVVVLLVVRTVN
jgi:hypothetical protein